LSPESIDIVIGDASCFVETGMHDIYPETDKDDKSF
jgi:hypothetical protein